MIELHCLALYWSSDRFPPLALSLCPSTPRSFLSLSPPLVPAEIIGAIVSVLLIWVLTAVLVYEAILRVINTDYEINADVMLIISCAGVFLNVLWVFYNTKSARHNARPCLGFSLQICCGNKLLYNSAMWFDANPLARLKWSEWS